MAQPVSPHQPAPESLHWGTLRPFNEGLPQIDFSMAFYQFGSDESEPNNHIILRGLNKVQFIIRRDGRGRGATTIIQDISDDGTYLSGQRMAKGHFRILQEGNEISFGVFRLRGDIVEPYRYIYREVKAPEPSGLLDAYDMESEPLSSGTFGEIRTAIHCQSGEKYALKIIKKPLRPTERFSREIEILSGLNHYYICKFKEAIRHNTQTIIVMEYAHQGNLQKYIDDHPEISRFHELNAQIISFQICTAMAYVHFKGVIHLDIKPENILVALKKPLVVKVADFGISKMVDGSAFLNSQRGTPLYMAPEIVDGSSNGYNNLVDSWSFGATLLYLITSKFPFKERRNVPVYETLERKISNRQIEWKHLDNSTIISRPAKLFIRSLLEDNPAQRTSLTASLELPWLLGMTQEDEMEMQEVARALLTAVSDVEHHSSSSETVSEGMYLRWWRMWRWWQPLKWMERDTIQTRADVSHKYSPAILSPIREEVGQPNQVYGELPGPHRPTRQIRAARNSSKMAPISASRRRSNTSNPLVKTLTLEA